jgi:hypothetical protein
VENSWGKRKQMKHFIQIPRRQDNRFENRRVKEMVILK